MVPLNDTYTLKLALIKKIFKLTVQLVRGQSFKDLVKQLRSVIISHIRAKSLSQPNSICLSPLTKQAIVRNQ